VTAYEEPGPTRRYEILEDARSLALVGASSNPSRASYFVASYLAQDTDYELWFVNPRATRILGRPAFPSLADLPGVPDIVVAFRREEELPEVARQTVGIGARVLWIQLGLRSEEAASIALDAGLEVVMDRCVKIEHARFHGGLHLGGFATGVISARIAGAPGRRRSAPQPDGGRSALAAPAPAIGAVGTPGSAISCPLPS
jgi:predicted CoA-binding protein